MDLINSELGKKSEYKDTYDSNLLFPIPRQTKRQEIGIEKEIPFNGYDIWNAYEISYLNKKGKPIIAIAKIHIPCTSKSIIESKSMKLYFNSLNNSKFNSENELIKIIEKDFSNSTDSKVIVNLFSPNIYRSLAILQKPKGICIDDIDVEMSQYKINHELLKLESKTNVEETLNSHLLKSNCLITNQPDWATITIKYKGPKICKKSLLKYIISFRNHNEFHEQCVERIFVDLQKNCACIELAVYAQYTRRGGIDINPYRSNYTTDSTPLDTNSRDYRQ